MRFRSAVPGLAFLQCCGWFPFVFHKSKRLPAFCLMAGLLPALFVSTTVAQSSAGTPIFQFGIFYNLDLEINPGAPFTVSGRVHCNTNIYCTGASAGSPLTFLSSVDAAGKVTNNPSPLDPMNYGYRHGYVVFPAGSPITNYDTLNLPLGASATNYTYAAIESLLRMPPAAYALGTVAAYTTSGQNYFVNRADLIITNDATGTNITVLYQNQYNSPNYLIKVAPDVMFIYTNITYTTNQITHLRTTNTMVGTNLYYSYVTNVTFYDYREGDTVKALQIDVARLDAWLGNNSTTGGQQYELMNAGGGSTDQGHVINSIFVYNSVNPTAGSPGTIPAVRLVNGAQLPTNTCGFYSASGLGIATAQPIYVKGNYNVTRSGVNFAYTLGSTTNGCTLPAALYGDAVTVLSSNFVDYATVGNEDPTPSQSTITLNAACFEGIVPSNGSYYSGGLENFLRLLENWAGKTVTYNGSFVAMFPSVYATNHWGGSYYGAPTRSWGFDTTFSQLDKLPPLTPLIEGTNPPVIGIQPTNQTVLVGSTAIFSVTLTNSWGFSYYQWSFNGTNIAGATNTSLTLANVQTNQSGIYRVQVTNAFGSILSSNAVLTVTAIPPSIQAQPTNQTVFVNGTAMFSVAATGSWPLSYQWNFNGTDIDGATNASLTLTNVNTNNVGAYLVVVTNLFGSVTSSVATLVVVFPPAITVQPTNQAVLSGSNVTLSVTVTGTGPLYYQWFLNGVGCSPYPIVAGTGVQGYSGDNGPATNAMLAQPSGLAVDAAGNLYIADYLNNRIRRVDTNGIITTVAGSGSAGFWGDGYRATNAALYYPTAVAVDVGGNLYIADTFNNRIRKVDTNGIITTVAGNGSQGHSGDGGPATDATFLYLTGIAVDSLGNIYIADYECHRIRKVDTNGIITTVAGKGSYGFSGDGGAATDANLARPAGVTVDVAGNLYIADRDNNRIRKVDTNGIITTVAGNGILGLPGIGGAATNTSLALPNNIAMDAIGNLYIAGYTNYSIFKVDTNGIITAVPAAVHSVGYVAVDAAGNLYYDDTMVNQTRLKTFMGPTLTLTNVDLSDAGSYFVAILTPYGSIISSNVVLSVYTTAAATLNGCSFSCVNGVQFQVAGVPGFNYAMQSSTNLIDWVSLITNTAPFSFTDTNTASLPQQFYRAIYLP